MPQKEEHYIPPKKLKKVPQKPLAVAAQMAQTEEFMFQIVAYRPTVYRTGDK